MCKHFLSFRSSGPFAEVSRSKLNLFVAALAGILFSSGWWIMLDLIANDHEVLSSNFIYYLPGIIATISLFVTNSISIEDIFNPFYNGTDTLCGRSFNICMVFFALMLAFGSLIWASYILIVDFLNHYSSVKQWLGWGIWLQNVCLFSSNMLMRFGRKKEDF